MSKDVDRLAVVPASAVGHTQRVSSKIYNIKVFFVFLPFCPTCHPKKRKVTHEHKKDGFMQHESDF